MSAIRSRVLVMAMLALGAASALAALAPGASAAIATRSPSARASTPACSGQTPRDLRLTRLPSLRARLSWKPPKSIGGAISYRVQRSGRTVGQTTHGSLVLRVTPGRVVTLSVQARSGTGSAGCWSKLRSKVPFRGPGRVAGVWISARAAGKITLTWKAASRGDAPIAGYRVERDAAVVGQTHARSYALKLSSGRPHRVVVAAVDTRGHLGPASAALVIAANGQSVGAAGAGAPSTPAGLSVAEVSEQGATVQWLASKAGGARIIGYRVYRDGQLVGQTPSLSMRLSHLTFPHTYTIAVSAIDASKHESARSAPLSLSTTHEAPGGSPLIAAEHVTDTSATLSWQPGTANTGTLAGYMLYKDGAAVGVFHGQSATVALASAREYVFTVRAVDSLGYLSEPAPNVTVVTTHTPPPAPTGLSASRVTSQSAQLSWSPSTAVSGEIVGYRVFRDGIPVGQTATPEMSLTSLAPSSGYEITVVAADSLGAISEPTTPLTVHTAEPTPTSGAAQAFLLASTDQSFDDLQAHYQQIGVVYPTYYECGAGGEVTGKDDPLVTGWAEARRIEVMPRLNCQSSTREAQILNNAETRTTFIENLASLCRTYGYQGIQIDFEGAEPSERNPFTAFITALAEKLHSQGNKLSTIVTAKYYNIQTGRAAMYDDAALSAVSNYIFVLDWGIHWTTSGPGSIDEYAWFKRVAEYTATMPNLSKFVLGMPMYGIDWAGSGGSGDPGTPLEYEDIVALASVFGALPEWDSTALSPHFSYTDGSGVHHQVWYTDKQSIGLRTELAASLGLKIGLWHLGSEDQSVWSLPQLAAAG
ncbi:MAG TPA: fibronectin type III domain-containing protein [Solirubrobacteraceae bacterium]|jgi:spore germination protein YaaH|nr:fibronectin type III domain-containing protein [Solirubrobacteraceae bacterium]